jgi:hypothetical protein
MQLRRRSANDTSRGTVDEEDDSNDDTATNEVDRNDPLLKQSFDVLRAECRRHRLVDTGTKADIVRRLRCVLPAGTTMSTTPTSTTTPILIPSSEPSTSAVSANSSTSGMVAFTSAVASEDGSEEHETLQQMLADGASNNRAAHPLSSLTVNALKQLLSTKKLPVSGNKLVLLARAIEANLSVPAGGMGSDAAPRKAEVIPIFAEKGEGCNLVSQTSAVQIVSEDQADKFIYPGWAEEVKSISNRLVCIVDQFCKTHPTGRNSETDEILTAVVMDDLMYGLLRATNAKLAAAGKPVANMAEFSNSFFVYLRQCTQNVSFDESFLSCCCELESQGDSADPIARRLVTLNCERAKEIILHLTTDHEHSAGSADPTRFVPFSALPAGRQAAQERVNAALHFLGNLAGIDITLDDLLINSTSQELMSGMYGVKTMVPRKGTGYTIHLFASSATAMLYHVMGNERGVNAVEAAGAVMTQAKVKGVTADRFYGSISAASELASLRVKSLSILSDTRVSPIGVSAVRNPELATGTELEPATPRTILSFPYQGQGALVVSRVENAARVHVVVLRHRTSSDHKKPGCVRYVLGGYTDAEVLELTNTFVALRRQVPDAEKAFFLTRKRPASEGAKEGIRQNLLAALDASSEIINETQSHDSGWFFSRMLLITGRGAYHFVPATLGLYRAQFPNLVPALYKGTSFRAYTPGPHQVPATTGIVEVSEEDEAAQAGSSTQGTPATQVPGEDEEETEVETPDTRLEVEEANQGLPRDLDSRAEPGIHVDSDEGETALPPTPDALAAEEEVTALEDAGVASANAAEPIANSPTTLDVTETERKVMEVGTARWVKSTFKHTSVSTEGIEEGRRAEPKAVNYVSKQKWCVGGIVFTTGLLRSKRNNRVGVSPDGLAMTLLPGEEFPTPTVVECKNVQGAAPDFATASALPPLCTVGDPLYNNLVDSRFKLQLLHLAYTTGFSRVLLVVTNGLGVVRTVLVHYPAAVLNEYHLLLNTRIARGINGWLWGLPEGASDAEVITKIPVFLSKHDQVVIASHLPLLRAYYRWRKAVGCVLEPCNGFRFLLNHLYDLKKAGADDNCATYAQVERVMPLLLPFRGKIAFALVAQVLMTILRAVGILEQVRYYQRVGKDLSTVRPRQFRRGAAYRMGPFMDRFHNLCLRILSKGIVVGQLEVAGAKFTPFVALTPAPSTALIPTTPASWKERVRGLYPNVIQERAEARAREQNREVSSVDFLLHSGFVLAGTTRSATTPARNFLNHDSINEVYLRRVERSFKGALALRESQRPTRMKFWNGEGRDLRLGTPFLAHECFIPTQEAHARLRCIICNDDVRNGWRCALCGEGTCGVCWGTFHSAHDLVRRDKPVRETMDGVLSSEVEPRKKQRTGDAASSTGTSSSMTSSTSGGEPVPSTGIASAGTTGPASIYGGGQGSVPFPSLAADEDDD